MPGLSSSGLCVWVLQQQHATETEETCTTYNTLKLARYLFRWTGAPAFADYYERAMLNGTNRRCGCLVEPCTPERRQRAPVSTAAPVAVCASCNQARCWVFNED